MPGLKTDTVHVTMHGKTKFVLKFSPQSIQHNINEYIQQYNVPGLKTDTVYVTMHGKTKFVLKFSPQSIQHNINEYIQQYNVPGLKTDTVHVTMQQFWSIKYNQITVNMNK